MVFLASGLAIAVLYLCTFLLGTLKLGLRSDQYHLAGRNLISFNMVFDRCTYSWSINQQPARITNNQNQTLFYPGLLVGFALTHIPTPNHTTIYATTTENRQTLHVVMTWMVQYIIAVPVNCHSQWHSISQASGRPRQTSQCLHDHFFQIVGFYQPVDVPCDCWLLLSFLGC